VADDGFVHAVVDDFLDEMVGAGGVRVHPGTAPDGIESRQDFDIGSLVIAAQEEDNSVRGRRT
jgi:hypothetical protein